MTSDWDDLLPWGNVGVYICVVVLASMWFDSDFLAYEVANVGELN